MDVSSIAALATENSQNQTAQAVQMAVLKKAIALQGSGAIQLIQAATQSTPTNPPNLGNSVDTFA